MKAERCTFAADEHRSQLAYFQANLSERAGHRGRGFQLRPEHRLDGLIPEARGAAEAIFEALKIQWHPYIGHGRSSQACCLNFLMPLAERPELLLRWVQGISEENAAEMIPLEDARVGDSRYVAFEYTGPDGIDYLGESEGKAPPRGANATAADAAIAFVDGQGRRQLWLIEWKYTESYLTHRLSPDRNGTRVKRYAEKAFDPDGPIRADLGLELEDFFHEPLYQLLRQQMLAWQIEKSGAFDLARVLHLSPAGNRALHVITAPNLREIGGTAQSDLFEAYRATLRSPDRFLQRAIEEAFAPLATWPDAPWYAALANRYPSLCPAAG